MNTVYLHRCSQMLDEGVFSGQVTPSCPDTRCVHLQCVLETAQL